MPGVSVLTVCGAAGGACHAASPDVTWSGHEWTHQAAHSHTHGASMKPALLLLLTASCCRANADSEDAEEELKERIGRKARLLTEAEGFDISALPLLSSALRNTTSCPGVEEEVRVYR